MEHQKKSTFNTNSVNGIIVFKQFNFFIDEIDKIFIQSRNMKSEKIIESLLNFKKNEGCNKIIMKALIDELSNFNSAFILNLVDHKYLFEFDED